MLTEEIHGSDDDRVAVGVMFQDHTIVGSIREVNPNHSLHDPHRRDWSIDLTQG